MDLKGFIAQAREAKNLSFRELEKRAGDLDHAYIWRLTTGDREMPSQASVDKLSCALELRPRQQQVFSQLVKGPIEDALYQLMLDREDIPWEDFEPVATMSFRGSRPRTDEEWIKLIDAVRVL